MFNFAENHGTDETGVLQTRLAEAISLPGAQATQFGRAAANSINSMAFIDSPVSQT
jgi:hypothetical protein